MQILSRDPLPTTPTGPPFSTTLAPKSPTGTVEAQGEETAGAAVQIRNLLVKCPPLSCSDDHPSPPIDHQECEARLEKENRQHEQQQQKTQRERGTGSAEESQQRGHKSEQAGPSQTEMSSVSPIASSARLPPPLASVLATMPVSFSTKSLTPQQHATRTRRMLPAPVQEERQPKEPRMRPLDLSPHPPDASACSESLIGDGGGTSRTQQARPRTPFQVWVEAGVQTPALFPPSHGHGSETPKNPVPVADGWGVPSPFGQSHWIQDEEGKRSMSITIHRPPRERERESEKEREGREKAGGTGRPGTNAAEQRRQDLIRSRGGARQMKRSVTFSSLVQRPSAEKGGHNRDAGQEGGHMATKGAEGGGSISASSSAWIAASHEEWLDLLRQRLHPLSREGEHRSNGHFERQGSASVDVPPLQPPVSHTEKAQTTVQAGQGESIYVGPVDSVGPSQVLKHSVSVTGPGGETSYGSLQETSKEASLHMERETQAGKLKGGISPITIQQKAEDKPFTIQQQQTENNKAAPHPPPIGATGSVRVSTKLDPLAGRGHITFSMDPLGRVHQHEDMNPAWKWEEETAAAADSPSQSPQQQVLVAEERERERENNSNTLSALAGLRFRIQTAPPPIKCPTFNLSKHGTLSRKLQLQMLGGNHLMESHSKLESHNRPPGPPSRSAPAAGTFPIPLPSDAAAEMNNTSLTLNAAEVLRSSLISGSLPLMDSEDSENPCPPDIDTLQISHSWQSTAAGAQGGGAIVQRDLMILSEIDPNFHQPPLRDPSSFPSDLIGMETNSLASFTIDSLMEVRPSALGQEAEEQFNLGEDSIFITGTLPGVPLERDQRELGRYVADKGNAKGNLALALGVGRSPVRPSTPPAGPHTSPRATLGEEERRVAAEMGDIVPRERLEFNSDVHPSKQTLLSTGKNTGTENSPLPLVGPLHSLPPPACRTSRMQQPVEEENKNTAPPPPAAFLTDGPAEGLTSAAGGPPHPASSSAPAGPSPPRHRQGSPFRQRPGSESNGADRVRMCAWGDGGAFKQGSPSRKKTPLPVPLPASAAFRQMRQVQGGAVKECDRRVNAISPSRQHQPAEKGASPLRRGAEESPPPSPSPCFPLAHNTVAQRAHTVGGKVRRQGWRGHSPQIAEGWKGHTTRQIAEGAPTGNASSSGEEYQPSEPPDISRLLSLGRGRGRQTVLRPCLRRPVYSDSFSWRLLEKLQRQEKEPPD
uniref:Uncharacterized protein n=1 Tax=Chromera velia CCMP2878 TaxID=1169474 RepID=A0A0G4H9G8_9ALVE|eukprot:Cvel_5937.t1-p1 / transcript=Cvel_5937.t1 / gene=Cvel_5937 / organism=Chromera_velia_CCMP2878 / gene_product=hypothetical protein / transcript_product=hypothetical protein / location=Cvel_scaffold284:22009-27201(-) / protein_length=1216 / sequence_SO=supercontig / SO=protein_coding / is_pseudo=false